MVPLCRVLLTAQGCENLPQGRAAGGVTAKEALASLPSPLASSAQRPWTHLNILPSQPLLMPLKRPVLLQETEHEFPEPAHLPGAATWDREQG